MKNIKFAKLDPNAPVFKLHADDYGFEQGNSKPYVESMGTKVDFINDLDGPIGAYLEDNCDPDNPTQKEINEAFKCEVQGSGDGNENYFYLTIVKGEIVPIVP